MKKFMLFLFLSLFCLVSYAQVSWSNDPLLLGGQIRAAAKNANCVLVANRGGVFKTIDQGQNWTNVTPSNNAYSVNYDQIVSIGSDFYTKSNSPYSSGVFKSTNDGASWSELQQNSWSMWSIGKLSNTLYAVGNDWNSNDLKLYSSTDGNSWSFKTVVWSGNWTGGNCELLSFSQNKLFLRLQLNLYYTTDGENLVPIAVSGLSVSDFSSGEMAGDATGNIFFKPKDSNAIYKYNFQLQTWSDIVSGKIPSDYQVLNFSVTDNAVFFTAMPSSDPMKIYRSDDQGSTFSALTSSGISLAYVESIVETGTNIFIGNDLYEHILVSSDGGESWSLSTSQYITTFAGCVREANNSLLYLRGNLGIIKSDDSGSNWSQANNGIPSFGNGVAYFTNQLASIRDSLFAFVQPDPFSEDLVLYKSLDAGGTWAISSIPSPYDAGKDYSFSGKCDSILFVNYFNQGTSDDYSLIYTSDYGAHWYKPNIQNSSNPVFLKGPKNCLFAFSGNEDNGFSSVLKANSFGMSFSGINSPFNNNVLVKRLINENGDKSEAVMDVDVAAGIAVFVAIDQTMNNVNKLYSYNITTQQWSELSTSGLPGNYTVSFIKYTGNNEWLMVTNFGLFKSTNSGQTWTITHNPTQWQKGMEINSMIKIGTKVIMGTISNAVVVVDLSIPFALPNNKSAKLDGIQDRIRVSDTNPMNSLANPAAYKISGTSITMEAWIYPMDVPAANQSRVIFMRPGNNGWGVNPYMSFHISIEGNAPVSHQARIGVAITDGMHLIGEGYEVFVEDTASVKVGQWTHVAGTYDGTTVKLYINGVLANQLPLNVSMGSGSTGLYIGGASVPGAYFKGMIDEVRLWNTVRTATEIQSDFDETLIGNETGLAGYWPMEESYITGGGALATVDKSPNHNDLQIQFDAELAEFPQGSAVVIPTTNISYSGGYAVVGEQFKAKIITNGWPAPTVELLNFPTGLTMIGDSIFWTPGINQFWVETLSTRVSNPGNTFVDDYYIESEAFESVQNQIKLDLGNHGRLGTFGNYNKGLFYKTQNGLYSGAFSLVDRNNMKYSGGLYTSPFRPNESYSSVPGQLQGFDAVKTSFSDEWESNRIGVDITQTVHKSSVSGDDKYIIVEYNVKNISGNPVDDLFAQLTQDFDIGNSNNNLGGYDATTETIYMYEPGGANNPYYYGFSLLNKNVSGAALFQVDANYVRTAAPLTTIESNPTVAGEFRCQLNTGPFLLNNGESQTIAFAVLAGDDLTDLLTSAARAKLVYANNGVTDVAVVNENQLAGYSLGQNYPNPFRQISQINYAVGKGGKVSVRVYDLQGKIVSTLVDETKTAGNYSVTFNAQNVAEGIYYYQLQADNCLITKKMVVIK